MLLIHLLRNVLRAANTVVKQRIASWYLHARDSKAKKKKKNRKQKAIVQVIVTMVWCLAEQ